MKYNHEEYKKFAVKSDEKDYDLMNVLLDAAKDYFLGNSRINIQLTLWECTPEAEDMIRSGVCLAKSPLKACVKTIEYLSEKYDLRIFNGDSDSAADISEFCKESVSIPFAERKK